MGELPPAPGAIPCEFKGEDGSRQRAAPAVKSTSAALDRARKGEDGAMEEEVREIAIQLPNLL